MPTAFATKKKTAKKTKNKKRKTKRLLLPQKKLKNFKILMVISPKAGENLLLPIQKLHAHGLTFAQMKITVSLLRKLAGDFHGMTIRKCRVLPLGIKI